MNLSHKLGEYGLCLRGVARLTPAEAESHGFATDKLSLALVGNIGSSYWPHFSQSEEFRDGAAHPLDRWSRRVAQMICADTSLQPVYPFEGPPYYPFQQWALRAEALLQSPLGIMMHPEYGLWHSYRFALLGDEFDLQSRALAESPCLSCEVKPCLQACPVIAFDTNGYDVEACAGYLQRTSEADCHDQGCLARYACPVAPELNYTAAQSQFHLSAFLNARP
ncbi:MAG: 4Fe-4S dicluster domain-containing protein [Gammaproteobacteria bacterium]|nr:4Fe-4S dicluster domain-containing protein [Gammaproteobacteria bacterium]